MKALLHPLFFLLLAAAVSVSADEVRLQHDGLTLNADLQLADGKQLSDGALLITHGTLAHNDMELIRTLQRLLASAGYNSLAINLSLGLDDRHGMYDCATPHRHQHTDALDEIGLWLDWLKQQGAQRVALMGHSRGGNQTAWFAAERGDDAVSHVLLLAPQTWSAGKHAQDYEKRYGKPLVPVLEKARQLSAAGRGDTLIEGVDFIYCENTAATANSILSYYAEDERMDTPVLLPRIPKPVMVFAGSDDTTVEGLVEKVEPLADGENIQLYVVDGAGHFFRDLFAEEVVDEVSAFIGWD